MADYRPTEEECEDAIVAAATALGYYVHAERRSRSSKGWRTAIKGMAGWPDLVIVGHGRIIVRELKRKPNRPSPEQMLWLEALRGAGVDADVLYVPEGQDAFLAALAPARRRTRQTLCADPSPHEAHPLGDDDAPWCRGRP